MELIQQLVSSLGVNEDQAKGGAGLLFNLAKEKLGSGEFQQLADKIPGVSDLLGAAPAPSGAASAGGGMMGALGGVASSLGRSRRIRGQVGGIRRSRRFGQRIFTTRPEFRHDWKICPGGAVFCSKSRR